MKSFTSPVVHNSNNPKQKTIVKENQRIKKYRVFWKYKTGPFRNQEHSEGFDSESEMVEFIKIVASPDKKITNIQEKGRVLSAFKTLKLLYKARVINAETKEG